MLNKQLQGQLMLDAAPLTGLLGSHFGQEDVLEQSRVPKLQMQTDLEKEQLLRRLSQMEGMLHQQQHQYQQSQQTITKLQAQIILLEERYRLADGVDSLQGECLSHQGAAFRHLLDADLAAVHAALSPGSLPSTLSIRGASAFAAAASSATSPLETSSSGGSSSTTAAGPASSSIPSGGGDSSSSSAEGAAGHGPWSHPGPFHTFGLNPAPSAPSHIPADLAGSSTAALHPGLDTLGAPLSSSLSGLSRSLSLSAAAAGAKQHRPRQPGGSAGGALAGDKGAEEFVQDAEVWPAPLATRTQSLLSTRDLGAPPADTWRFNSPSPGIGGLAAGLAATPAAAAAGPAGANSSSGFPMRTPPQPILGPQSHSRHGHGHGLHNAAAASAVAAATAAAAAAAAASPWGATPGMSPSTIGSAAGALAAGLPSSNNMPFSPASWEHPLLVAGRQGSLMDPMQQLGTSSDPAAAAAAGLAEYHSFLAAAAAGLDVQAVAAAAAASASHNAGLHPMASDRFSHDSNLARLLPVDLKRLVTEGSLGSLPGSLQQGHSGLLAASHGSLDDLQQALLSQQLAAAAAVHHQGQQQQSAAAIAAAAAAAVAAMQGQNAAAMNAAAMNAAAVAAAAANATVRGGKPLQPFASPGGVGAAPLPMKSSNGSRIPIPTSNSKVGSLGSSRSHNALLRAASGPASSAFLDADDPAALFGSMNPPDLGFGARGQSEVVFSRGSGSFGGQSGLLSMAVEAEARERERRVVRKWTDCWGPDSEVQEQPTSPTGREGYSCMSRSLPAAASGLAAAAGFSELPDTAESDLPDQDSLLRSSGGGVGSYGGALGSSAGALAAAAGGLGLRQPSGCSLTRSASALAASEMSGCNEDGAGAQDLDAAAQNARLRSKQDACPNTCVYVGFLGWWVTEKDLIEYFSPYGELVSVRLLISKKSRRSREQAFVEYAEVDQAQRAITWLDSIDNTSLVKQLGCGGLVVRFADRKKPAFE